MTSVAQQLDLILRGIVEVINPNELESKLARAIKEQAVLGACYGSPCFFLLCVYRMGSMAAAPPPIKFQA
ncbi:MAG: hypothetical protein E8D43_02250 [Nitrospira sp.]|nr:MAG: hypothetical protein E8D43_02250 [Nitrospira sp.]